MSHTVAYRALQHQHLHTYRRHASALDREQLSDTDRINAMLFDLMAEKSEPFSDEQIQAHQRELCKFRKRRPFCFDLIIKILTDPSEYRTINRTHQKLNAIGNPTRIEFKKLWRSQSISLDQAVNLCAWFAESELDVVVGYSSM